MKIAGLTKLSLVDFPGKVCAVVFCAGCNFACPFCHNAELIPLNSSRTDMPASEVVKYLAERKAMLDGVCVSGGEPLLGDFDALTAFLAQVKALGLAVKLDTNGSNFTSLKRLAGLGLVDYIAMDVKAPREKFAKAAGVCGEDSKVLRANVQMSLELLLSGSFPDFELRTTVVGGIHTSADIDALAREIAEVADACKTEPKAIKYFLQTYSAIPGSSALGYFEPAHAHMSECLDAAARYLPAACLRG